MDQNQHQPRITTFSNVLILNGALLPHPNLDNFSMLLHHGNVKIPVFRVQMVQLVVLSADLPVSFVFTLSSSTFFGTNIGAGNYLSCGTSYSCAHDGQYNVWGCCQSPYTACQLYTSCLPYTSLASCGADCSADPYLTIWYVLFRSFMISLLNV